MDDIEIHNNLLVYKRNYSIDYINKIISDKKLDGLRIFYLFDFDRPPDLLFLKHIKKLKSLSLFIKDTVTFDFLYELTDLTTLHIQTMFSEIDFSKLTQLTSLSLQWNKPHIKNINALKNLLHLSANEYDERDLESISGLVNLESLAIASAKCKSLTGIEQLVKLKALSIGAFKSLTDISSIASLKNLQYLEFDICPKLEDFSPVGSLQNIEVLELLDCKRLSTISFVKDMKKLEQLSLLGTTVINDGNLLPANGVERVYVDSKKYNTDLSAKAIPGKRRSFGGYSKR